MISKALSKLNKQQNDYCKTLSALIHRAMKNGVKEENERRRGQLRGFLDCLMQMNVLTQCEVRALYLWFIESDRLESR